MNRDKNGKMYLAFGLICLIFLLIGARIFQLQVLRHKDYSYKAIELSKKDIDKVALRGDIYDRNLNKLAYSMSTYDLWVNKDDLDMDNMDAEDKLKFEEDMKLFEEVLGLNKESFLEKYNDDVPSFEIARWLSREKMEKIKQAKIPWVSVYTSYRRIYPMDNLASHLIGAVDKDGQGIFGLEYSFDSVLRGVNGKYVMDTDLYGNPLALSDTQKFEAIDGPNIVTTSEMIIQGYLDKALEKYHKTLGAKSIVAVVMETQTGDILGMSSYPNFDLNKPREIPGLNEDEMTSDEFVIKLYENWKNPAISMLYEPGSVSKILTVSMGLEEGIFSLDDKWNDEQGYIQIGEDQLRCWIYPGGHGTQNTAEALINSCNPALVQMGFRIGKNTMYDYMNGFNLTYPSNLGLEGESYPVFRDKENLLDVELATMSYGHGYAVTPVQMLAAANAVVNDGKLMESHVIKRIVAKDGTVLVENKPKQLRQVISQKTSLDMREIMERLLDYWQMDTHGIRMGGKTGTTLKIKDGEYSEDVTASFFLFAPADKPKYSLLVVVDEPDEAAGRTANVVAAPIAIEIMTDIMRYAGIDIEDVDESSKTFVPDVTGSTLENAIEALSNSGLDYATTNYNPENLNAQTVLEQYPAGGSLVLNGAKIILNMGDKESQYVETMEAPGREKPEDEQEQEGEEENE